MVSGSSWGNSWAKLIVLDIKSRLTFGEPNLPGNSQLPEYYGEDFKSKGRYFLGFSVSVIS